MEGRMRKLALGAAVAVLAIGLGAGSAASAKVRIPEEPEVTLSTQPASEPTTASETAARTVVSLGWNRHCGREAFAFKTGKRRGIPMC